MAACVSFAAAAAPAAAASSSSRPRAATVAGATASHEWPRRLHATASATSALRRPLRSRGGGGGGGGGRTGSGVVYARVSGAERTDTGAKAGISSQISDIRAQMAEDKDLNTLMAGLRGRAHPDCPLVVSQQ
jgi:hypothetical protein